MNVRIKCCKRIKISSIFLRNLFNFLIRKKNIKKIIRCGPKLLTKNKSNTKAIIKTISLILIHNIKTVQRS